MEACLFGYMNFCLAIQCVGNCMTHDMSSLSDVSSEALESVLGSVSFLIYVIHIASSVSCSWRAFADDFKLYLNFPPSTYIPCLV